MTIRQALGGQWSTHWLLVLALFSPATFLVLIREIATPFPQWWWPLASAVLQHSVVAVIIIIGGNVARRRHRFIPIPWVFTIWGAAAVVRGIVAGEIAARAAGVDPEYVSRAAIWLVITVVWMPALVYAMAQLTRRSFLLAALDATAMQMKVEIPRNHELLERMQRQQRRTIIQSISPALLELQNRLTASREQLDPSAVVELSRRLTQLHNDATDLLTTVRSLPPPVPAVRISIRRAFDVPPRLHWRSASLVTCATIALVVFDAWRVFGTPAAIEIVVSTTIAGIALGIIPMVVRAVRPSVLDHYGQKVTVAALSVAIGLVTYVMLNSGIDSITWHGLLITPLLAAGLVVSSAMYFSAIVMADANAEAHVRLEMLRVELDAVREHFDRNASLERERLTQLMHGPVQGRIAACIMALNFYSSGGSQVEDISLIIDSVLDHLRAVSRDLDLIAGSTNLEARAENE
jgi:hypothetical protein